MKKLIAAAVVSLSLSFSAVAGVQFDHWTAEKDHIITAAPLAGNAAVSMIIFSDMSTAIGIDPNGTGYDEIIHEESTEFQVNGQPIKATVAWHSNGAVIISPQTKQGNSFVANSAWKSSRITVKFKEFEFWLSAKGVQKAWKFLHSRKQAI